MEKRIEDFLDTVGVEVLNLTILALLVFFSYERGINAFFTALLVAAIVAFGGFILESEINKLGDIEPSSEETVKLVKRWYIVAFLFHCIIPIAGIFLWRYGILRNIHKIVKIRDEARVWTKKIFDERSLEVEDHDPYERALDLLRIYAKEIIKEVKVIRAEEKSLREPNNLKEEYLLRFLKGTIPPNIEKIHDAIGHLENQAEKLDPLLKDKLEKLELASSAEEE